MKHLAEESETFEIGLCDFGCTCAEILPKTLNWDELCAKLNSPITGEKDGPYFTRSSFTDNHRHGVSTQTGHLVVLDGDSTLHPSTGEVVDGAPEPNLAHEVLTDLDVTHCIYTSHSNGKKGSRYRVVVLADVESKKQLAVCVNWLVFQLHQRQIYINSVSENYTFEQAWYLPRVPDKAALDLFRFYEHDGGQVFDVQAAIDWDKKQNPPLPETSKTQTIVNPSSPIGRFNSSHGIDWILETLTQHGYGFSHTSQQEGEPMYRLVSPVSSSGVAGICVLHTEKGWVVYSHHGEQERLSNGHMHDAFSLHTLFEFEGDMTKALQSLEPTVALDYWDIVKLDPEKDEEKIDAYRVQERKKFNNKYGLLMVEGQACVIYRELNNGVSQYETKYTKPASLKQLSANHKIPFIVKPEKADPYIKWEPVFDDWMQRPDRRTYSQPVFNPVCGLLATTEMPNNTPNYNTYIGAQFEPAKGDCSLILDHIKIVWCRGNQSHYDYVMRWLARMIQEPNTQGRTVIVLRSGEGGGKNIILDLFDDFYGSHSSLCSSPKALVGFNAHLASSVFVFMNESVWGGDKKSAGTFKTLITEKKLTVEQKYLPEFKAKNNTHLVIATNSDWAAPIGLDDRRFFMLDLDTKTKDQRGTIYFNTLVEHIEAGGREAFLYHLMHEINLTGFNVADMPINENVTKLDHKLRGADSITSWWSDVLAEGGFIYEADLCDGDGKREHFHAWPEEQDCLITSRLAYESYLKNTKGHVLPHSVVTIKIAELLGVGKVRQKRRTAEPRIRQYLLPALPIARLAFEALVKQRMDWGG